MSSIYGTGVICQMGPMDRDFSIPIDIISIHYIFINKKSIGESYRQKVIKVKWSKCQLKLKHKASAVLLLYSLSFHLSVNHADNYSSSPHAEINHCWSIKTKWLPFSSPSVSEWMGHLIFIYHVPLSNGRSVMCTGLTYPMRFKVTLTVCLVVDIYWEDLLDFQKVLGNL